MIIDWFSFTIKIDDNKLTQTPADRIWLSNTNAGHRFETLHNLVAQHAPNVYHRLIGKWWRLEPRTPRAPYRWALGNRTLTIFAHPDLDHILIEITGKGCAFLRDIHELTSTVKAHAARATRLDVAADLQGVTPDEIVKAGVSGRFRSRSRMESDQGTTIYVGSRKSERFARVYRYNKPHPRHGLCRVEVVHRKDYARALCDQIATDGLQAACKSAMSTFEWGHHALAQNAVERLSGVSINKDSAKTETWLIRQAAPAFKRLVAEGVIEDPIVWLMTYFTESGLSG